MRCGIIGLICAALLVFFIGPASAERRVALVIGNSAYGYVSRLDNPGNDARLMADTLRRLGFAIVGDAALIDLDKAKFDTAVRTFGDLMSGADVALFYYAGHGIQVRGSNHLVPIDANPTKEADVDFQLVDVAVVLRQMEGAGTRLNLVLLDACRNNPFGGRGLRSGGGGLAQMSAPEGTFISYATQPGNIAQDGTDGDSPYTKALAQTIQRPGLGIFEAFNEVGLKVKQATGGEQQPWLSSSPISGNFYFAGPLANATDNMAATDPAERTWGVIQNTTSPAVLEEFVRQYGKTVYGGMARGRLEELKNSKITLVAPPPPEPKSSYSKAGNFACFSRAEYPDSWRAEASICAPYGCNFGKMSEDACLALGAKKRSKTVIHGNTGTTRANECWLQQSCGELRPHYEFTLFKM